MAPIDVLLITTEFDKDKEVAVEVAKIPEVRTTNALGGYNLPDRVLAMVYFKRKPNGKASDEPKRFGEIRREIEKMNYVEKVESLGISNQEYKKDKEGNVKEKWLE
jgi:hypothetical protein